MKPESNSIEKFAIAVAVGSVLILAGFLIVDAFSNDFLPQFTTYAGSNAWPVVAAIPALTFAYIVGAFMLVIADFFFQKFNPVGREKEWLTLEALARAKNELLNRQFEDLVRTKRVLEASVIPLALLTIGIIVEIRRLSSLEAVLIASAIGVGLLAILSPIFTIRIGQSIDRLRLIASNLSESDAAD
jgi:uncharacterized membrane protein (DUF485 family)